MTDDDLAARFRAAQTVALDAGALAQDYFAGERALEVALKGPQDVVTAADGEAERHLYAWDALAGLLLVEEAGGSANAFLAGDALTAGNVTIAATPALYAAIAEALAVR